MKKILAFLLLIIPLSQSIFTVSYESNRIIYPIGVYFKLSDKFFHLFQFSIAWIP